MTDDQIKHMVDRFLAWKLPDNFYPDGGVSLKLGHTPFGTNLLDATQAKTMVLHMLEGLPGKGIDETPPTIAELEALLNSEDSRPVRITPDGKVVEIEPLPEPPPAPSDGLVGELRRHEREYAELIHGPLCGDAASRITELEDELAQERRGCDSYQREYNAALARITELEAERDDLISALDEMRNHRDEVMEECDSAIEKITDLEAGAVAWEKTCERINREADAERDAAVEQVKTLREALERIANQKGQLAMVSVFQNTAKAALASTEPKP